jgi:hypothetical protein
MFSTATNSAVAQNNIIATGVTSSLRTILDKFLVYVPDIPIHFIIIGFGCLLAVVLLFFYRNFLR